MIILGASMTPQLQVGLEGWGSYDIHLDPFHRIFHETDIYLYNQEIHKIHKAEMLKCMVWRSGVI